MVIEIKGGILGQNDVRETVTIPKSRVSYWSCSGANFVASNPDTDQVSIENSTFDGESSIEAEADNIHFQAEVHLPHGAIVTRVIIYGDAAAHAETWELVRLITDGTVDSVMATKNIGTADATISDATIDNQNYTYQLSTTSLDTNDSIQNAYITYTTTN